MLHLSVASCTYKSILSCKSHRSDIRNLGWVKQVATLLFQTSSAPSFRFKSLSIKAIAGAMSAVETDSPVSKRALISLSEKTDLALLGDGLQELGFTIVSTGGTASALEEAGISVTKVEDLTGFPEMLDGRVKTLHPNIHGGILARRDQKHHMEALNKHGIGTFDVVVVNLYPFYEKVTAADGISYDEAIENVDIGGTTMIKASAKNHKDVLVVIDSKDYPSVLEYLRGNKNDQKFREHLAYKAFQHVFFFFFETLHVVAYDSAVLEWMSKQNGEDKFPSILNITLERKKFLRYGENEHQKAALYADKRLSVVSAGENCIQHHGEDLSYSNILDVDAAWNCVCEFNKPTCVIVKHESPCGAASNNDIIEAYRFAVKADPKSPYGGVVAFNVEVDEDIANEIRQFRNPVDGSPMFYHIVVAPKYSEKGLEILKGKSNKLKILQAREHEKGEVLLRQIGGGDWLAQESDDLTPDDIHFKCVSDKCLQGSKINDVKFAYLCVKHIKSNAIVLAKDERILGMGGGQPNRLQSINIALEKAGDQAKGAVLASDGFFPFDDAVEKACQSGVSVVAEPGGSKRDQDVIDCCNKYGVSLLFTGVRHFKH